MSLALAIQPPHVDNHVEKGGTPTNQRSITPSVTLKRAMFWMQDITINWVRSYAKVSGLSQGALINAILLDYQLKHINMQDVDPQAYARMERYVEALLGCCPELKPAPFLRVAQGRAVRQADKLPK